MMTRNFGWWLGWTGAIAVSLALAGCGTSRRDAQLPPLERIAGHLEVPHVLTTPAVALLTNDVPYIARIETTETLSADADPVRFYGQVFVRQNRLYLAPAQGKEGRNRGRWEGISFIWDTTTNGGFALSEALQAFAPISAPPFQTIMSSGGATGTEVKYEGHACIQERLTIGTANGTPQSFDSWKASDLNGLRLKSVSLPPHALPSVQLSEVRSGNVPMEVFLVPSGFTAYPSLDAMEAELVQREGSFRGPPTDRYQRGFSRDGNDRLPTGAGFR
jgi:hypothetical protein